MVIKISRQKVWKLEIIPAQKKKSPTAGKPTRQSISQILINIIPKK